MIPLCDANPSRGTPVVNYAVIALCVPAFVYELLLGKGLERFLFEFGLIPARIAAPETACHFTVSERFTPLLSSMFLHGGRPHLIGNMWILHIFGGNVESELGHLRYGTFYVISGLIAAVIHVLTNFGTFSLLAGSGNVGGIAWRAHAGGFVGGRVMVIPLEWPRGRQVDAPCRRR